MAKGKVVKLDAAAVVSLIAPIVASLNSGGREAAGKLASAWLAGSIDGPTLYKAAYDGKTAADVANIRQCFRMNLRNAWSAGLYGDKKDKTTVLTPAAPDKEKSIASLEANVPRAAGAGRQKADKASGTAGAIDLSTASESDVQAAAKNADFDTMQTMLAAFLNAQSANKASEYARALAMTCKRFDTVPAVPTIAERKAPPAAKGKAKKAA